MVRAMDFDRVMQVLAICAPVFAVIGAGKLLGRMGWFNADHMACANRLVYYFALPALIFREVARQRFAAFWEPGLILCSLGAIVCVALLYLALSRLLRYRGPFAAAFIFGSFWANVTYMGFPLSLNAFGDHGLALAAIYNAFVMPVFVAMGFLLLALHADAKGGARIGRRLRLAVLNPIVLAAAAGIAVALIAESFRDASGAPTLGPAAAALVDSIDGFLRLIGGTGLPLALLTIGASLKLGALRAYAKPLAMVTVGKLLLLPLLTMGFMAFLAPGSTHEARGIAVLLAATPNAVASYVIARQAGVPEGFMASMLVLGTLGSVITIPFWLYWAL